MKKSLMTLCAVTLVSIVACNKPEVKFDTLEDARAQARANAEFNAAAYRSENPRLTGTKIVTHGDSTQDAACPQGDGWASVSFMAAQPDGQMFKVKAKCSTVSGTVGCWLEQDFNTKPFAAQENHCDSKLPFPLPKIAK